MEKKRMNKQMQLMVMEDAIVIWGRKSKDEEFEMLKCFLITKDGMVSKNIAHALIELTHDGYKLIK